MCMKTALHSSLQDLPQFYDVVKIPQFYSSDTWSLQIADDVELFTLVLGHHLSPNVVNTCLYPRLVDHILASQAVEAGTVPHYLQVETIANQLLEAGHHAEAGTLLMQHRATHTGLRTFDTAFSIVSRLFR